MTPDNGRPAGIAIAASGRGASDLDLARKLAALRIVTLRKDLDDKIHWRQWVKRRPYRCLLAALAVGFVLAHLTRRARTRA